MADIFNTENYIKKSISVNRCTFAWRTILPNFILIRFEMTEP